MATDAAVADAGPTKILDRAILEQRFDGLLAANGPSLTRLAASYTNSTSDRDDLLQEIGMAIWKALPQFRGECSERTFLFRIAHNRAIAFLSRSKQEIPALDVEVEIPDAGPTPESGLARAQVAGQLKRAVQQLPIMYRQVAILTLEGLGYSEIAEVLGISESNVGVRMTRARKLLRASLEKQR